MKLHQNASLFKDAIIKTAQLKGLPEIYIEKDYWVTFALYQIAQSTLGDQVIFKGGTALSKCYHSIERFSEDIDIVLFNRENTTANQLKKYLKELSNIVSLEMPEVEVAGITNKKGLLRKTAHSYPQIFEGKFGQVRNQIILESSWLGAYEPYAKKQLQSYIFEMISKQEQFTLIKEYGLEPFTLNVLSEERTICEKIMSLVRFSRTATSIQDLNNKIRHLYDLKKLLSKDKLFDFLYSEDFEVLLKNVAIADIHSFRSNNEWIILPPHTACIFADSTTTWKQLSNTYNTSFRVLVYGTLPSEKEILGILNIIYERLQKIKWDDVVVAYEDLGKTKKEELRRR